MLASGLEGLRLTLHVMAASVWVGGQVAVLGLIGPTQRLGADAARTLTRALTRLVWPAFAVLVITGFWNISTFHWAAQSAAWKAVLITKLLVVALSGLAFLLYTRSTSKRALAWWGSLAGLTGVAALTLGILLAG
jgi:putative copper export protein